MKKARGKWGKAARIALGGAMAMAFMVPAAATPAFADNGLQDSAADPGRQTYTSAIDESGDETTGSWSQVKDPAATTGGKIDLLYSTSGGKWTDGEAEDPTSDEAKHDNGTYLVTIPTKIAYENMSVGAVSTDDDYTVNVRGVIPAGQQVKLTAETGNALSNASQKDGDSSSISETTTQGKTVWSGDDTSVLGTDDASTTDVDESTYVVGTDATDNIKMTGAVKSSGTWEGTVGYTAQLEAASSE